MKTYIRFAILAGLVVGLASLPAFAVAGQQSSQQQPAQQQQQGQKQSGQQPASATPNSGQAQPAVPKMDPEEEKAYTDFHTSPSSNPQAIVKKGEDFMQKYPNSRYAGAVYARLAAAYEMTGDSTKMFVAGHKALLLNPDNVDVLSLMAYSIPRRINPKSLEASQQLQEAQQDATHALELLAKMQKPANLSQEQFDSAINAESASCHSGLGLVYYYQHNIPGMVSELEQAVKLDPSPDAGDQFLLGFAYLQAGRYTDAEGILQKCTTGPLADRCKSALATAKQHASQPQAQPKQ